MTSGVGAIAADPTRGLAWTIGNSSNGSTHTVSFIRESNNSVHATSVPATTALTGLAVDPATGKAAASRCPDSRSAAHRAGSPSTSGPWAAFR
ncbi:MAG TPA: hypothetical protein VFI65_28990 [Streptosporangiaceae bacterium]|nr:hypothetical protein [Streptosporangiaceae bacterium]